MDHLLRHYREKRNFKRSPEPAPAPGLPKRNPGEGRFVIQLHHARRRHYDFRLEIDGVLKSWAIPKGPSLDPDLKRLAVEVEDHPMEYRDFTGDIPAGEYGAGHVEIWDQGRWRPEGDPAAMLQAGELKFTLLGARLGGSWALVRTRLKGRTPQWLLVKHRDAAAIAGDEADEEPIEDWLKAQRPSPSPTGRDVRSAKRAGVAIRPPVVVELALATSVKHAPAGDDWLHEVKYDGYRILLWRDGETVRLLSRGGVDWTAKLPGIAAAVRALPCSSVILDAELVALDADGISRFALLQERFGGDTSDSDLTTFVFDVLFLNGDDLRCRTLIERRDALEKLLAQPPDGLVVSSLIRGNGEACEQHARELGLEGVVSKRADSRYEPGRSGDWRKTKIIDSDEFAVVGYTAGRGARQRLGALLLARPIAKAAWRYVGRVGSGLDESTIDQLLRRFQSIEAPVNLDGQPSPAALQGAKPIWVRPRRVVEVEFRGLTRDGLLRQAALKAIREDKTTAALRHPDRSPSLRIAQIHSESTPVKPASAAAPDVPHLTHADRLLWTDPHISKAELADYYRRLASWVLPDLVGRPLSLLRCPDGMAGECFFQKQPTPGFPSAVRIAKVGGSGTRGPVIYIDDLEGLIGLVQMNVLELHVWGARIDRIERPDRMVMDLDPAEDVDWTSVIAAARLLRQRLQRVGLESFVRTSGGKGLHVVVPLTGEDSWSDVKDFTHALARTLASEAPDRFIDSASKAKRKGLIFIDWLRNSRGATAIASYSPRARPGAPVAAPLSWEELGRVRAGSQYRFATIERRLKTRAEDPWKDLDQLRQALPGSRSMNRLLKGN